jgi:hypothetical protein
MEPRPAQPDPDPPHSLAVPSSHPVQKSLFASSDGDPDLTFNLMPTQIRIRILPQDLHMLKNQQRFFDLYVSFPYIAYLRSGQFRDQKSLGPLKISLEIAHKVICPPKKIIFRIFKVSGTLRVIFPGHVTVCIILSFSSMS